MRQLTLPLPLEFRVFRLAVHREYVDVEAEVIFIATSLKALSLDILYLGEKMNEAVAFHSLPMAKAAVTRAGLLSERGDKTLIIRPWHQKVYVIVPRDEAFVTHGPEEGTVGHGIPDALFGAEGIHGLEYVKEIKLNLSVRQFLHNTFKL